jgi:predicted RNase H-like HicB family nuclease
LEKIITLHIERLPEGVYLATSDDIQGLVAQGPTASRTIGSAEDIAKKLLEARRVQHVSVTLKKVPEKFDCSLVVEA